MQAQKRLLEKLDGSAKLEISWSRMYTDVSLLQFKEREREEDEVVAE